MTWENVLPSNDKRHLRSIPLVHQQRQHAVPLQEDGDVSAAAGPVALHSDALHLFERGDGLRLERGILRHCYYVLLVCLWRSFNENRVFFSQGELGLYILMFILCKTWENICLYMISDLRIWSWVFVKLNLAWNLSNENLTFKYGSALLNSEY